MPRPPPMSGQIYSRVRRKCLRQLTTARAAGSGFLENITDNPYGCSHRNHQERVRWPDFPSSPRSGDALYGPHASKLATSRLVQRDQRNASIGASLHVRMRALDRKLPTAEHGTSPGCRFSPSIFRAAQIAPGALGLSVLRREEMQCQMLDEPLHSAGRLPPVVRNPRRIQNAVIKARRCRCRVSHLEPVWPALARLKHAASSLTGATDSAYRTMA